MEYPWVYSLISFVIEHIKLSYNIHDSTLMECTYYPCKGTWHGTQWHRLTNSITPVKTKLFVQQSLLHTEASNFTLKRLKMSLKIEPSQERTVTRKLFTVIHHTLLTRYAYLSCLSTWCRHNDLQSRCIIIKLRSRYSSRYNFPIDHGAHIKCPSRCHSPR